MSSFLKEYIVDPFKGNKTRFGIDNDRYEADDGVMLTVAGCSFYQTGAEATQGKMTKEALEQYINSLDRDGKMESTGWKYVNRSPPELKVFLIGLTVPNNNEYSWFGGAGNR